MQLFSSSAKSQFSPLFTSQNPNPPKFFSKIPIKSLLSSPLFKSTPFSSKQSTPSLDEKILIAESDDEDDDDGDDKMNGGNVSDGMLIVRRPVMESTSDGEESENLTESEEGGSESAVSSSSSIDQGLSEFAKKIPIFEPERVDGSLEKPLPINLELALYKAKVFARKFQFEDAEKILRQAQHVCC